MKVNEALATLGFKSVASIARILLQKSPQRRQERIKGNTKLTDREVNILKQFKHQGNFSLIKR